MEKTSERDETRKSVEPTYVYTGPKTIARLKMRLAEWLERRGW
ncbi:hypothetical protein [Halorussus salinus]|nr:hypothetical protein [Halorussus salinus]